MPSFKKHIMISAAILIGLIAVLVFAWSYFYFQSFEVKNFQLGVNFSKSYSEYLGLDWQKTYLAILDDLKVKNVRVSAPWNEIEPASLAGNARQALGRWNFTGLDWQVKEAEKRGVNLILIVGRRTPHWPECHDPAWIKPLAPELVADRQMEMIAAVVDRYKDYSSIKIWQVENEPLLDVFGKCPPGDIDLLRKEIALVKTLDSRPVMITDSGEIGDWTAAANIGDLFGTTLYRVTHNPFLGYFYYHLPPVFYNLKARLVGQRPSRALISELQAEPWAPQGILNTSLENQKISMDARRLASQADYGRRTGFSGAYLWGAEWWYWLKEKQNDDTLWKTAKNIFLNS
ncbi:MAG: hypothetical protein V1928_02170 [Parcubacteria group bacterium]